MKTAIKILIPVLVLAGIGFIIFSTQKSISQMHSQPIDQHNFKEYVRQYAKDSIDNQTPSNAQSQYAKLYDIITTEASVSITSNNGRSALLDNNDAGECYENIFRAYFPIFRNQADQLFSGGSWYSGDLTRIKDEAQSLLKRKGSSVRKDSLSHYISYVNGYYSCKNLIKSAQYCRNLATYRYVSNHYGDYCRYPYRNCQDLNSIKNAPQIARDAWKNFLENEVNAICNRSYYGNTESFGNDRARVESSLDEYKSNIDYSWASRQISRLGDKARRVVNNGE